MKAEDLRPIMWFQQGPGERRGFSSEGEIILTTAVFQVAADAVMTVAVMAVTAAVVAM